MSTPRPVDSRSWPDPDRVFQFALAALVLLLGGLLFADSAKPEVRADVAHGIRGTSVRVARIELTVSDLERARAFYTEVLDFVPIAEREATGPEVDRQDGLFGVRRRTCIVRLGSEELALTEYLVPVGRAVPPDARSNDGDFQHVAIVVSDMERAYERLRHHRVRHASTGPQTLPDWNRAAGGIQAFYFRDPDGHPLELIRFPSGKGDPRWQGGGDRLFLGIDHTAIVVADSQRSLAFYRDLLGLRVVGTSENHGPEQEHLSHVEGAHLRITTLRSPAGPGVEFLEYRAPRNGRAMPADSRPNDIWASMTTLEVEDLEAVATRLASAGVSFASSGPALLGDRVGLSLVVRDPDGHLVRLVARQDANR